MCSGFPHLKQFCLDFPELSSPFVFPNIAPSLLIAPASCQRLFHPVGGWYAFRIQSTPSGLLGYVLIPVTKFSFMLHLRSLYFAPFAPLSFSGVKLPIGSKIVVNS